MGSVKPRILEDSPDVYSTGYRCIEEGWGKVWLPYSLNPYYTRPDGKYVVLVTDDYVPYVVEDSYYVVDTLDEVL